MCLFLQKFPPLISQATVDLWPELWPKEHQVEEPQRRIKKPVVQPVLPVTTVVSGREDSDPRIFQGRVLGIQQLLVTTFDKWLKMKDF